MVTTKCLSLIILFVSASYIKADHLPKEKLATGSPERTLATIDIYTSGSADLIHTLGPPTEILELTGKKERQESKSGEIRYSWRIDGALVCVTAQYRCLDNQCVGKKESLIYAIDVWCLNGSCDTISTGRGLRLSADLSQVSVVYGRRVSRNRKSDGNWYILVQWPNDTLLTVDADSTRRIHHIQLLRNIE